MKAIQTIVLLLCLTGVVLGNDCFVGEYWSASGQCEQCHISCSTCSSAEGCSTCYDQMFLSAVGNQIQCKLCYQVNVNCQICSSAQKCTTCSNGFFLNENSTCSACSEHTPHCVYCQQNQTYVMCIACQYPRRVSSGICLNVNETLASATAAATVAANAPANVAASASTAFQTSPSPSGSNNVSVPKQTVTTQTPPSATAASGSGGQVSLCNLDQVEISGVCILAIPFCLQYNLTTLKCRQCTGDCLLSDQGYCIPAIIMATQGQPSQGAQSSNISNKTEIKQTAADCVDNQYFWYDQCVTIGTECINRTANNKCEACIRGFLLKNGYCMQIPPSAPVNNTAASTTTTVATTGTGSKVQQGSAQGGQLQSAAPVGGTKCNFPCLSCSSSSPDECLTCESGYTTVDAFPGRCFSLN